jgi:hypothetical protein
LGINSATFGQYHELATSLLLQSSSLHDKQEGPYSVRANYFSGSQRETRD